MGKGGVLGRVLGKGGWRGGMEERMIKGSVEEKREGGGRAG